MIYRLIGGIMELKLTNGVIALCVCSHWWLETRPEDAREPVNGEARHCHICHTWVKVLEYITLTDEELTARIGVPVVYAPQQDSGRAEPGHEVPSVPEAKPLQLKGFAIRWT